MSADYIYRKYYVEDELAVGADLSNDPSCSAYRGSGPTIYEIEEAARRRRAANQPPIQVVVHNHITVENKPGVLQTAANGYLAARGVAAIWKILTG